ncbi:hypothetical protein [Paenarthrobacter ilicis]|uniref:hypothetical protein n=1 Tax=Paenarthrobacter ilicis TaxID=43665 RepID=UPI0028D1F371|nr:hypothetical protein [Paenarthrobacter ilicis]
MANAPLLDAMRQRYGGVVGTGGLGAVSLRVDHGDVNLRDKVLPITEPRDVPISSAINPGQERLDLPENAGVTWADRINWNTNFGTQYVGHGMLHTDATTTAGMTVELVDSKALLKTSMPTASFDMFAVAGVGGTGLNGWTGTTTPEHFGPGFEAARLVLANYGACTGYLTGTKYRLLDGNPRNGEWHKTMDNVIDAQEVIDEIKMAQAMGAGLQLMVHPSRIDYGEGYITTAIFQEIVTYLADERDAGRLVLCSMSGLLLADASTSYRNNLVRNGKFKDLTAWSGAGYTTGVDPDGTTFALSSNTAGLLSQSINISERKWAEGGQRELTAKLSSPDGAVGRLSIVHATKGLSKSVDVVLPAGAPAPPLHKLFSIPVGSTNLTLSVGRLSGGRVRVEDVGTLSY